MNGRSFVVMMENKRLLKRYCTCILSRIELYRWYSRLNHHLYGWGSCSACVPNYSQLKALIRCTILLFTR